MGGVIGGRIKSGKTINAPIIEDKIVAYVCAHKRCSTWNISQSLDQNCRKCALISLCPTNPHKGDKKDTIEGTIRIGVKLAHQTSHVLNGQ
jgi:hypothetical protein